MATKSKSTCVELKPIELQTFTLNIVGDSPLIVHAWSQKTKLEIVNKQQKRARTAKEVRRPAVEFADSLYWLTPKPNFGNVNDVSDEEAQEILAEIIPQSKFGFPVTSFKKAALDAGYQQGALARNAGSGDLAKTTARGAFYILDEFAVIDGTPIPREDIVRIPGTVDVRYRAEFKSWRTSLVITYNHKSITAEQIVNLFRLGGFANGVGEWRPAKGGSFGTFHIE